MLAEIVNDGNASEDDVERATKKMEEIVQEGVAKVEEILATKEKDIMTI
jgi:ribosome recycling factor